MASILKRKNKKKKVKNFSRLLIVTEDKKLKEQLFNAVGVSSEITSKEALFNKELIKEPIHCFLDMNYVTYGDAIRLIERHREVPIYFRFLTKKSQFAVGSDSSEGLGVVISY